MLPSSPNPGDFTGFSGVHFNGIEPESSSPARSREFEVVIPAKKKNEEGSIGGKIRAVLGDKTGRSQVSARVVSVGDFDEVVVPTMKRKGKEDKENVVRSEKKKHAAAAAAARVQEEEEEEEGNTEVPLAKRPKSPRTSNPTTSPANHLRRSTRTSISTTYMGSMRPSTSPLKTPTKNIIKQTDVTHLLKKRNADKVTDDELTLPDGNYSVSYDKVKGQKGKGVGKEATRVVRFEVVVEMKRMVVSGDEEEGEDGEIEGMVGLDLPSIDPVVGSTPKRKSGDLGGEVEEKKKKKKKEPMGKKVPEKTQIRGRKTRASLMAVEKSVNNDNKDEDEEGVSKSGKEKLKRCANKEAEELQSKKKPAPVKKSPAKKAPPKRQPAANKKNGEKKPKKYASYDSGLMDLVVSDWE